MIKSNADRAPYRAVRVDSLYGKYNAARVKGWLDDLFVNVILDKNGTPRHLLRGGINAEEFANSLNLEAALTIITEGTEAAKLIGN